MPLIEGPSLGGNARHVRRQYAEENALARERTTNAAGNEEFGGGCLRGRYNNLRETVQPTPSIVVVPSLINAGGLFVQRPVCRTNYLVNNAMLGAIGSVLPTAWASGAIPAGFTFSVGASGQATANDGTVVDYVDITVSGTATASGAFNIFFGPSSGTVQNAVTGQTFALSTYATCISGDITTPAMVLQVQEVSGSTFQAGTSTNIALASGAPLQRVSAIRTLNQGNLTAVRGRFGHPIVSGTTYDYTIRIGSPQLERLGRVTPMIRTGVSVTGAVTVLNESSNVVGLPPDFTVTRDTSATRVNSSGLIEVAKTNHIRNNSMVGANVSTNTLPTNWAATLNGLSSQVIAIGTETGVDYIDIKLSGTATSTVAVIAPESSTQIVAASGQTWTNSLYIKIISQPSPPSSYTLAFREGTSGGSFVNFGANTITPTTTLQRLSATRTLTGALTERVQPQINFALVSGSTYDFTIRIGWPQMEQSAVATSPIPTTTAAVTRNADVISASGVSGLIGATEGTIYAEFNMQTFGAEGYAIRLVAASFDNSVHIVRSSANNVSLVVRAGNSNVFSQAVAATGFVKAAVAYKSGDMAAFVNGTQVGTTSTSSLTFGASFTAVNLGAFSSGLAFLNDRIRSAALYTTRLSNYDLMAITSVDTSYEQLAARLSYAT